MEFETFDTWMELPEVVRGSWIRDSELVEDEGVEVWDNTIEESARARGIGINI